MRRPDGLWQAAPLLRRMTYPNPKIVPRRTFGFVNTCVGSLSLSGWNQNSTNSFASRSCPTRRGASAGRPSPGSAGGTPAAAMAPKYNNKWREPAVPKRLVAVLLLLLLLLPLLLLLNAPGPRVHFVSNARALISCRLAIPRAGPHRYLVDCPPRRPSQRSPRRCCGADTERRTVVISGQRTAAAARAG